MEIRTGAKKIFCIGAQDTRTGTQRQAHGQVGRILDWPGELGMLFPPSVSTLRMLRDSVRWC